MLWSVKGVQRVRCWFWRQLHSLASNQWPPQEQRPSSHGHDPVLRILHGHSQVNTGVGQLHFRSMKKPPGLFVHQLIHSCLRQPSQTALCGHWCKAGMSTHLLLLPTLQPALTSHISPVPIHHQFTPCANPNMTYVKRRHKHHGFTSYNHLPKQFPIICL